MIQFVRGAVLVAIVTVLVGPLCFPELFGGWSRTELSRTDVARTDARLLCEVALSFRLEHERWPQLEDLVARDKRGHTWLATLPLDPWGHDYDLRTIAANRCEVRSRGPDGEPDTSDDIIARSR